MTESNNSKFKDLLPSFTPSELKHTLHGDIYQLKLLQLILLLRIEKGENDPYFYLTTEAKPADAFDDAVYLERIMEDGVNKLLCRCLQAKHSHVPDAKITWNEIITDEKGIFSIFYYYSKYCENKKKFNELFDIEKHGEIKCKMLVLCTNLPFGHDVENNFIKFPTNDENDIFLNLFNQNELYNIGENIIGKLKTYDKLQPLAKELLKILFSSSTNKELAIKSEFEYYHNNLVDERVIDKNKKGFHTDFINNCLHEWGADFRIVFNAEYNKNVWTQLNKCKFNLNENLNAQRLLNTTADVTEQIIHDLVNSQTDIKLNVSNEIKLKMKEILTEGGKFNKKFKTKQIYPELYDEIDDKLTQSFVSFLQTQSFQLSKPFGSEGLAQLAKELTAFILNSKILSLHANIFKSFNVKLFTDNVFVKMKNKKLASFSEAFVNDHLTLTMWAQKFRFKLADEFAIFLWEKFEKSGYTVKISHGIQPEELSILATTIVDSIITSNEAVINSPRLSYIVPNNFISDTEVCHVDYKEIEQSFSNLIKAEFYTKFLQQNFKEVLKNYENIKKSADFGQIKYENDPQPVPINDNPNNTELKEFVEKFIFAVNQPNEIKLGETIKKKVSHILNLLDGDLVADYMLMKTLNWMKKKNVTFRDKKDVTDDLKEGKQKMAKIALSFATIQYCNKLRRRNGKISILPCYTIAIFKLPQKHAIFEENLLRSDD